MPENIREHETATQMAIIAKRFVSEQLLYQELPA